MRGILGMLPSRAKGKGASAHLFAAAIFCFVSLVNVAFVAPAQAQNFQFTTISIDGNVRVDDSTIIGLAGIRPGQSASAAQVNRALTQLSGSGLFEDVSVEPRGNTLLITVREYPVIGVVNFEGNRRLDDDVIAEVVQTTAGRVLSPSQVEADARAIAELYSRRGRTAAEVTPEVLPRGNNRVDLAFVIREGNVVEIERISFVGNRAFSNYRLRQVLSTKQAGILRLIIQSDTFIAERIALDRQLLTDFYLSRGYVDFEILSVTPEIARERDRFFLTFNLREGQQYRFGNVTVVSEVEGINAADYEGEVQNPAGALFTPNTLDLNIARLEQRAERQGLRFIRAEPRFTRNNRTQTIDVEFAIVRGERILVERIDIQGNTTTQDRVVRRQFRSAEGDSLNPREIREAAERIRALDYFTDVNVEPRAGSAPDQAILDVEVEETTTGSLGFSVSYSANDGIGFGISFSELNFLGRGQEVAVAFNVIKGSRDISLFFTEPALFDRDLSYTLGIGYQETSSLNSRFDTREAFLNNSISFPISEFGRLQLRQGLVMDRLKGLDAASSERIRLDETAGTAVTGSLGYTYSYDTRNVGIDPTRGMILSFSQDFGVGNQSRRYVRSEARAGYEMAIFNEDVTLTGDVRAGMLHMINGSSRFRERFQLASVMRGFRAGDSGPRDFGAGNDDVLGGNRYFAATAEARFPLGTPEEYGLSGGIFADVGSVWGVDNVGIAGVDMTSPAGENSNKMHLRATLGVSLFWDSPLGTLRFDFSRPIRKRPYDRTQNFDFTIVSNF
ncbi:outer membrane protein assembly factor BamA [Roseinatronobacter alkalisoli]|uniref:Outer membrane protein assembly factor BamA n=1 Tax=Roseinatronobacter alkalisoli TaxID=3028235 RepID=A0ABT5T4R4_9RHOB|nr:outer membrane protein assembly factor BamA [Roseinatronobacter sp. HJB301]MDD7970103.1 outer membrane protein assembly factor BamA [Roseinatronobacter sp. HJB301]